MKKVPAIGIALVVILMFSMSTAFLMVEARGGKGVSIEELNNFVDPVTLKVQEMKALGMNDTEIVEALKPLGMGCYPQTGATWIGRNPTQAELQKLPPRRYLERVNTSFTISFDK